MLTLPFVLGLVLAGAGIALWMPRKSDSGKWIGSMLFLAGCLLIIENVLTCLFAILEGIQPGLYIMTLCIISITIIAIFLKDPQ